jgi:hypothetical protein
MTGQLVLFFIGVAIQTVFLAVGLFILIQLQQLNYNFLGLLGTALVVGIVGRGLHLILGHFVGIFLTSLISAPPVLLVLYGCLIKATEAERKDVYITVGVSFAMVVTMNLWLVGALVGEIRSSAWYSGPTNAAAPLIETKITPPGASGAIPPTQRVISPDFPHSPFDITGVTRNGDNSMVTVQTGKNIRTIFLSETVTFQTPDGSASVSFKKLYFDWVILTVNGKDFKVQVH